MWVPKYRLRILKREIKELLAHDLRMLCEWKKCEAIELNIQPDHIYLLISVSPKLSISNLMGILKGKLAIKIFKSYPRLTKIAVSGESLLGKRLFCEYNRIRFRDDKAIR